MLYDVFICHAHEDKESFVHPLAEMLQRERVEVWYDEFTLKVGDSIRRSLDLGLRQCRFGVVILSKAFFGKRWPQYELDGLTEREMQGRDKVILPVWHGVTHEDVFGFSPSLASRRAVSSEAGIRGVVGAILAVVRPQGSPLIVARDMLLNWGVTPPVVTDEYWLDVVEASNRIPSTGMFVPSESQWGRWSFPLPPKDGGPKQWGERLGWAAMQLHWVSAADADRISPVTRPERVLSFIAAQPGLYETCEAFPALLAEYAPQLTIPRMGGPFEQTFQRLYEDSVAKCELSRAEKSSVGTGLTVTGQCPLCGEGWALRCPKFGSYTSDLVACEYFTGGIAGPPVSPYEHIDHIAWLLSRESDWLPPHTHDILICGMKTWGVWQLPPSGNSTTSGALLHALHEAAEGKAFRWTKRVQDDALQRFEVAVNILGLPESPEEILDRFRLSGFPRAHIASQRKRERRVRKG